MSKPNRVLLNIFILAIVVASLDSVGQFFRLYWSVWWFDIFMHFLGGAFVGLLLTGLSRFGPRWIRRLLPVQKSWFYYLAILVIGIGWEIYEVLVGLIVTPEPYPIDTTIDIIMDLIGAYSIRKFYLKKTDER